jgi:putative tryptophan/tyrosine transport system substrate-binding protein
MKLLFFISVIICLLQSETILVMDSNAKVKKYTETIDAFRKSINQDFTVLDLSDMSAKEVKNALYDIYPDIVYAVGAKAYQYANAYIPEKTIYFSSIIDFKKFDIHGKRYGISNELHSGMQLTLIKSVFPNVKSLGVMYSQHTENILHDLHQNAQKIGIRLIPLKITKAPMERAKLESFIKDSDALMIIPDPLLLSNTARVSTFFNLTKKYKKAVIAYHELFINYGAVLALSVDNPTIGRQVAMMIQNHSSNEQTMAIQYPVGTHIIFNKHEADKLGLTINPDIAQITTKILE